MSWLNRFRRRKQLEPRRTAHELHPDVVHWEIGDHIEITVIKTFTSNSFSFIFQGFSDPYTIIIKTWDTYHRDSMILARDVQSLLIHEVENLTLERKRRIARGAELTCAVKASEYQQLLTHFQDAYKKLAKESV